MICLMKLSRLIYHVYPHLYLGLRIVECAPEDFKYFINLEELDISENEIQIE